MTSYAPTTTMRDPLDGAATASRVPCTHCGLDVPAGLVQTDATEQFCCSGCEGVWRVLQGAGLGGFYDVRDASEAEGRQATPSGDAFTEFSDPLYQQTYVRMLPGGLAQTEFLLEGVHCAACIWLLERLPRIASGVHEARAKFGSATLLVTYRPDQISLPEIARALDRLGYRPHAARGGAAREARAKSDRTFLVHVAVAGACAGNVMLMSVSLYAGAFTGINPLWETLFRWLSMGIGLIALAWPGRVFFRGALAALRTKTAHLDVPIALALAGGGLWGTVCTIRGNGEIYFDSLTVLVFLLLVGRWIQHRQQRSATDSIELMLSLVPSSARIIDADGSARVVPIESVRVGDVVEARAGDTFPADGIILEGSSSADESSLTGESRPLPITPGDVVAAGTTNLNGPVRVQVEAVGDRTRVGRLMARVTEADIRRVPIVRIADRIAGWFVLVVLGLAALTFALWVNTGVGEALDHTVALLIVACPCGLGLAVPMAMGVASGRAAKAGALVKDAASLQVLATPGVMILDKTGTITEGRPSVVAWQGEESIQPKLGALEQGSSHPIAMALASDGAQHAVTDRTHTPGGGVVGVVDGEPIAAGSAAFHRSIGRAIASEWIDRAAVSSAHGRTPILIAKGSSVVAMAELADAVRHDSATVIAQLKRSGWTLRVLSGDHQGVVDSVCHTIGLEGLGTGGASPEFKADEVRRLQHQGHRVMMIGDGVNDAAALATADVGIAVHGGAEASLEAAGVYLSKPGLTPVLDLVERAESAMRTTRVCLRISIGYNASAAMLAMGGLMSALLAGVLMPLSSLVVVAIALRAGRNGGTL